MSIQDDIFDIRHSLKDAENIRSFKRICEWAFAMEDELGIRREQVKILRDAILIVDPDICKTRK